MAGRGTRGTDTPFIQLSKRQGLNPDPPIPGIEGQGRYVRLEEDEAGDLFWAVRDAAGDLAWRGIFTELDDITDQLAAIELEIDDLDYIPTKSGTPTIAAQTAAGSTAVVSITGNDRNGILTITPGGIGITVGVQARVSFGVARVGANFTVHLTRTDLNAGTVDLRPTGRTTARFDLWVLGVLTTGVAYSFFYVVDDY